MAGLFLHTGNRIENLAEHFAYSIYKRPLPPLQKEIVIVQSSGMERWLNLQIASIAGIAANIDYIFPKAFVYDMFKNVFKVPEEPVFSTDIMTFKIIDSLPSLISHEDFKSLSEYLKNDHKGIKLYQLSTKLASLFDQYFIMRPDLITKWDDGENPLKNIFSDSIWQSELWRTISETDETIKPDHASLKEEFLKLENIKNLPERISLFGISTFPEFYLEIFMKLSKQIDVNIYYLNPCREYWEYAYSEKQIAKFLTKSMTEEEQYYDSGNKLLASMGNAGREFFSLLLSKDIDSSVDLFVDSVENSLLSCIQSDILNMRNRADEKRFTINNTDQSIVIHSCHSPIREVEVLYDNLLNIFDENKSVYPNDIVVMMPDVTPYVPLIHAVFGGEADKSKKIPYSISDTYIKNTNKLADTFLSILSINKNRFKVSEVIKIIENESVMDKFSIDNSDTDLIKKWIVDNGIHWGVNGHYKKKLGLPEMHATTWQAGLQRMLLGYTLPPEEDYKLFEGIHPYGEIEGTPTKILGSLINFTDTLYHFAKQFEGYNSLDKWSELINSALKKLFSESAPESSRNDLQEIREMLGPDGLAGLADKASFNGEVHFDVINAWINKKLEGFSRSSAFISSGVTFCTLLPMRSIPFKVVYLMGMNDGEFPKLSGKSGFSLIDRQKRLCDYSKRNEDRYLFLESILSAREKLIISYTGQSIKDNTELPPSVLVSELTDYISESFTTENKAIENIIFRRHPLQPFSTKYFNGSEGYFSYSSENRIAAEQIQEKKRVIPPFFGKAIENKDREIHTITLEKLNRFFCNPCEFIFKEKLNINFSGNFMYNPDDSENFNLDFLQSYFIKNDFTNFSLSQGNNDSFFESKQNDGIFPYGSPGQIEILAIKDEVSEFIETLNKFINGQKKRSLKIIAEINPEISVNTTLNDIYPEGQVLFRCAGVKEKDIIKAWISHLLLNISEQESSGRKTFFIARDKVLSFREMETEEALTYIKTMVKMYLEGLKKPLPFFPATSYAYAEKNYNNKQDAALNAARKKWYSGFMYSGDAENEYIRKCFGDELPYNELFINSALDFFKPYFDFCSVLDKEI